MYDWHKRAIDKILKELDAQCAPLFSLARQGRDRCLYQRPPTAFPAAAFHDKFLDVIFAMTKLSIDCDDKIKTLAKQFTKQEFESAFGRLIIKAHRLLLIGLLKNYLTRFMINSELISKCNIEMQYRQR